MWKERKINKKEAGFCPFFFKKKLHGYSVLLGKIGRFVITFKALGVSPFESRAPFLVFSLKKSPFYFGSFLSIYLFTATHGNILRHTTWQSCKKSQLWRRHFALSLKVCVRMKERKILFTHPHTPHPEPVWPDWENFALWVTFQGLWQQLFCPNRPHFNKVVKL